MDGKILEEMQGVIVPQNVSTVPPSFSEQKSKVAERLSFTKVLSFASMVWQDHPLIAELISTETSKIILVVHKRRKTYFSGKSKKRLLSGIFYLLGIRNKAVKTQREIARSVDTSEATVRASYRDWVTNFPDLFPDSYEHFE